MVPKLVYVAGRYRAPTGWGVEQNIQKARVLGAKVAILGGFPVVPHANTAHYDGINDDTFWLDGTLQLLRRCDAMIMLDGWKESTGARGEHDEAVRLDIPIFYDLIHLEDWLASARALVSYGVVDDEESAERP